MSEGIEVSNNGFERSTPREPKSPSRIAQIQAQNRRREYLTQNPSYFDNIEHELADPVLFERLVKRFHSAAEREAEVKAKGYGRTLEAALQRGESKLAYMRESNGNGHAEANDKNGVDSGIDDAWEQPAKDKEHGQQLWHSFLEGRFIHGRDEEFDYSKIDQNDEYDALVRQDAQDAWFDEEEPSWVQNGQPSDSNKDTKILEGETGIQDF